MLLIFLMFGDLVSQLEKFDFPLFQSFRHGNRRQNREAVIKRKATSVIVGGLTMPKKVAEWTCKPEGGKEREKERASIYYSLHLSSYYRISTGNAKF